MCIVLHELKLNREIHDVRRVELYVILEKSLSQNIRIYVNLFVHHTVYTI